MPGLPASHRQAMRRARRHAKNAAVDVVRRGQDERGGFGPPETVKSGLRCFMRGLGADEAERLVGGSERGRQPFLFHFGPEEDAVSTDCYLVLRGAGGDRHFEVVSAPKADPVRTRLRVVAMETDDPLGGPS